MDDVVIVAAGRTAVGKFGGSLAKIPAAELGAHVIKGLLAKTGLAAEEVAFIGDDVVDLTILKRVGFAVGVPNGRADVLSRVHHVTDAQGGRGAVRELCEFVLRATGNYDKVMAQFLV